MVDYQKQSGDHGRPWSSFRLGHDGIGNKIRNNVHKRYRILVRSELSNLPVTCTQIIAYTEFVLDSGKTGFPPYT